MDAERLRELLSYDPETGVFTWRTGVRGVKQGTVAGSLNPSGYTNIKLCGKTHKAHRLAWLYVYGEYPIDDVDHRNRVRNDNRLDNLRPASHSQNMANKLHHKAPSSGFRGVYWAPHVGRWRAELVLKVGGKRKKKILGYFDDPADAGEFRELAGRTIWGDYYLSRPENDNCVQTENVASKTLWPTLRPSAS